MSLILRHKPEAIGISLDEHGWAKVDELIAGIAKDNEFNMDILEEIVGTDEKQRYSFNEDRTLIRANQGHSIPVDVEPEEKEPPETLWHGTGEKYVESIDAEGLISKSRLYVHLSKDEETAIKVGMRHGKPVLYQVIAKWMYDDGYKFYISANGVSFPKYKYVVVWTKDTYELFKRGMDTYGYSMPRHRVIVFQEVLMHIASDGVNQIGFERALKQAGIEYQKNFLHYSKHDANYMYQLFCKCYKEYTRWTNQEICYLSPRTG